MAYNKYKTDNSLRKAFDAAYATPDVVKDTYSRLPKRLLVIVLSTMVLLVALFQITTNTLQKLDEGKQPPLVTRLVAPYDLSNRYLPSVDTSMIAARPIPLIDVEWFVEERDYQLSISAEPVTRDSILRIVLPNVDQGFFLILPMIEGYERNFIHSTAVHPSVNCLLENYRDTYMVEFFCEEGPVSQFIETADYFYTVPVVVTAETTAEATDEPDVEPALQPIPANQNYARVVAAQYETVIDAKSAIRLMFNDSRAKGNIGNFAMLQDLDVNYFYAYHNGWYVFGWSHDRWVFTVSAQDFLKLEDIIAKLPF